MPVCDWLYVSRCKTEGEYLAFIITRKMQLEAIKPPHCTFSSFCCFSEYLMVKYPFVVANGYFGGIDKGNPGAFAETDKV
jgi:hypothetical protein